MHGSTGLYAAWVHRAGNEEVTAHSVSRITMPLLVCGPPAMSVAL